MGKYKEDLNLHKARVGETAPVLKLADAPTRLYDTYGLTESNGRYPYLPSVSVAVPPGTPVGTYYGSFYLSDAEIPDPAWRSNSVTAVVTVTEARSTDGYTAGSMYHLDSTNSEAGDMTPAAYRDRTNNNIYMFWSSNRGGSGSPGSALDSWFLRQAKLPGTVGVRNKRYPRLVECRFGGASHRSRRNLYRSRSGNSGNWWNPA